LSPVLEKRGILGDSKKPGRRPGDVTFPCWQDSKGLAVDVCVTSPFSSKTFTLRVQLTTSASGNTESTTEALKGRTSGSALLLSRQRAGLVKKGSPFYDSFGGLLRDSRTPSCAFTQVELGQGCRATFRLRLPKQSYTGSRQEETHQPNQRRSRCQW